MHVSGGGKIHRVEKTGQRNARMVREICIFVEEHDTEQERQG